MSGNSLFSSQDLLVLQGLETFVKSLGPNNEWYLPSDPRIVQIFARNSDSNDRPALSTVHPPNENLPGPDQMLSKLHTEREAVGKPCYTLNHDMNNLSIDYSGI